MSDTKTYIIATYGTLKKGFHNNYLLEDDKFLGEDTIKGAMQLAGGGHPYIFADVDTKHLEDDHTVEVYEVSEKTYEPIKSMELAYGYYIKEVDTKYGKAIVFFTVKELFDPKKDFVKNYNSKMEMYETTLDVIE